MVPIAAIAWYRSPLPLFQTFSVIILEPVSKNFLEAPLKLITAVLQLLTFSEYHTRANDSELTMSSIAILPLLMNLLCYQFRDTICSIRSWQSCFLLQLLCSSVWCNTRSKHNLLDIPLFGESLHILSTTDIRLEILMIFMTRSTMNSSKVEDDIILCRSKWQVLNRLADIELVIPLLSLQTNHIYAIRNCLFRF